MKGSVTGRLAIAGALSLICAGAIFSITSAEMTPDEVEAQIDIRVAQQLSQRDLEKGEIVEAFSLQLYLVGVYRKNLDVLRGYQKFLQENGLKLSDSQREEVFKEAAWIVRDAKRLDDVFIKLFLDEENKGWLTSLVEGPGSEEVVSAFEKIEGSLKEDDAKKCAFYLFVKGRFPDERIALHAWFRLADMLFARGDYKAAKEEYWDLARGAARDRNLAARAQFGIARCQEKLGDNTWSALEYLRVWHWYPESELAVAGAEGAARACLEERKLGQAFSWCVRVKTEEPDHVFSERRLENLHLEEMKVVGGYRDKLVAALKAKRGEPSKKVEDEVSEELVQALARIEDDTDKTEEQKNWEAGAIGLMKTSADILAIIEKPGAVIRVPEELVAPAAMLWQGQPRPGWSGMFQAPQDDLSGRLLEANDQIIRAALREALTARETEVAEPLACVRLYFASTRGDTGEGEFDELLEALAKQAPGVREAASSAAVQERIASVCRDAGLFELAKEEYGTLLAQRVSASRNPRELEDVVEQANATGNYELSIAALGRLLSEFGYRIDRGKTMFALGEAQYHNHDYAAAKETWAKYVKDFPGDKNLVILAEHMSAVCDFEAGNYEDAILAFYRFGQEHPEHEFATYVKRDVESCYRGYGKAKNFTADQKREFHLRIVKEYPKTYLAHESHFHLGTLYYQEFKDFRGAIEHFRAALGGAHADRAMTGMASCHLRLGELDAAEELYRKVLRESQSKGVRENAGKALKAIQIQKRMRSRTGIDNR